MLEAVNLTRRYGQFTAVDDVSFQIPTGEVVGLLGHNGAGKTTIMKMLTGYLEPSGGLARIAGQDVALDPLVAQSKIGYLPENLPVYQDLSVADYLAYCAGVRGLDAATAVPRAVRATELEGRLNDLIATLSRGFKQRVGVAQAILHEPEYLILDEPTNGLDPAQTQQMRSLIRSLAHRATVVLSTHIMQEVSAVCDRALILRSGRLVVNERLEELTQSALIRVRAAGDGVAEILAASAGVSSVSGEPGLWQVEVAGDLDHCASGLTQALVAGGANVYEVAPAQRDLESIFREVNEGALA